MNSLHGDVVLSLDGYVAGLHVGAVVSAVDRLLGVSDDRSVLDVHHGLDDGLGLAIANSGSGHHATGQTASRARKPAATAAATPGIGGNYQRGENNLK